MATVPLPANPDLGQLRKRARELQKAVRAGDRRALALVAEHNPRAEVRGFALHQAQLVVARRYGFTSWPHLSRHLEIINGRAWNFTEESGPSPAGERFLRLACLNFATDGPERRARAVALVAADPALPATSLAVAAACADVEAVGRHLAADPAAAVRRADPYGWSPLMYQAYARHDPSIGRAETLATARLLLDAGAEVNDGRFFGGLPTPFTVLTGLFAGNTRELPAHPWAVPFAEVLLAAGADPNDGQTLYNRMFDPADDHLEVLFAHGLGRRDGGPWRRLLGDQVESPAVMLAALLDYAVSHDQRARVALMARNGVDVTGPLTTVRSYNDTGRTPIEVALRNGNRALADDLRGRGATEPALTPVDAFIGAALAGDAAAVAATAPEIVAAARTARPGVIVWAAGLRRTTSVELLVAAGFDIDALGRSDVPAEQRWHTALHAAVECDDAALARRLLDLGAGLSSRDERFHATPLDWARHLGRDRLVALLTEAKPSHGS
jgi:ankyrin repeat protein